MSSPLTPANENPLYVLMTLYGEGGKNHAQNRRVWNSWASQGLGRHDLESVIETVGVRGREFDDNWLSVSALVMAKHREVMLERNGEGFTYPGFPELAKRFNLEYLRIDKNLNVKGFAFTRELNFTGTIFESATNFAEAWFASIVGFSHAVFEGEAQFPGLSFPGHANFKCACFKKRATFEGVYFKGTVDFINATFSENAWFKRTVFEHENQFRAAKFYGKAVFDSAEFRGVARFKEAAFHYHEAANFSWAKFLEGASFKRTKFSICYPDFSGAVLPDGFVISARDQYWPVPKRTFRQTLNNQNTDNPQYSEEAREACATIRHALTQQGLTEEAHFFFRREMGLAGRIGSRWQRLPYLLYGWVSDYGYSIRKPFECLLRTWAFGFGWFVGVFFSNGLTWSDTGRAAAISFSNIFKFFGFQRIYFGDVIDKASAAVQFLSATQTILGFIFLFFLGLGLRQRFRLR